MSLRTSCALGGTVRPLLSCLSCCLLVLCLLTLALREGSLAALPQPSDLAPVVAQDVAVLPGDAAWPLTRQDSGALRYAVGLDPEAVPPRAASDSDSGSASGSASDSASGSPGAFRIDFDLAQASEDFACIGTSTRQSHYRSRGIEFAVRASRPLAGVIFITTSNPDDRKAQDRFFGTFVVGTQWKLLRLPFRSLAAWPTWPAEARRAGLRPGDLVLRPDSVEAIRIGVDARRTEPGAGTLWVGGIRFFR